MLVAIGFWALALMLAWSHYALAVAVPLMALLGLVGLKLLAHGVSIPIFLVIVGVLWGLGTLETLIEGAWLFSRDRVEQAYRHWTISISMIGLALTFVVAVGNARSSWDYINNGSDSAAEAGK
jgi:hypothetical protein